jgi:hypothetical protein
MSENASRIAIHPLEIENCDTSRITLYNNSAYGQMHLLAFDGNEARSLLLEDIKNYLSSIK